MSFGTICFLQLSHNYDITMTFQERWSVPDISLSISLILPSISSHTHWQSFTTPTKQVAAVSKKESTPALHLVIKISNMSIGNHRRHTVHGHAASCTCPWWQSLRGVELAPGLEVFVVSLHHDIPHFVQFRTSRILQTSTSNAIVFSIRTTREHIYVPTQLSPINLRFLYHQSISLWIPQLLWYYGTTSLIFLAHKLLFQSWSGLLQLKIRQAMPAVNTGFNIWLVQYVCTSICQIIRCLPSSALQL